ncbi:hypothetical protein SteCoe_38049 [Stentor coeruleus]|uniref:Uncharacterized protein n=1 Tax=Stentor coeruleus TaxID=5963 RepID=A0A1R2AM98_9CILI|nr:hypothetical protein SteCoe_38049 [Stentor coeruleus]
MARRIKYDSEGMNKSCEPTSFISIALVNSAIEAQSKQLSSLKCRYKIAALASISGLLNVQSIKFMKIDDVKQMIKKQDKEMEENIRKCSLLDIELKNEIHNLENIRGFTLEISPTLTLSLENYAKRIEFLRFAVPNIELVYINLIESSIFYLPLLGHQSRDFILLELTEDTLRFIITFSRSLIRLLNNLA